MSKLTLSFNWSQTSVSNIEYWPQSLQVILSLMFSSKYPMFLWWGEDLVQFYNDAYRPCLGNEGKHPSALGQQGKDCWQEIWPVIYPLIKQVLAGGSTWNEDLLIPIYRNGRLEDVYWTFGYSPVRDDSGKINGVLVICNETTEKIVTLKKLEESEKNFRNMILQSPVAMCIFRGPMFVVEIANEPMLELWSKTGEEVMNKPIFEGVPEVSGQGFEQLLTAVFTSGETFSAHDQPVNLFRKGKLKKVYLNFVYQALKEADGTISGISAIANEITDEIEIRHKIEIAEERARLAIEASGIGTYDVNLLTADIITSQRFNKIFGFDEPMPRHEYLSKIHPEDKTTRIRAHEDSRSSGKLFYETRILPKNKIITWIRVEGTVYKNAEGIAVRILGTIMDITEIKYLIKQKDNFIAIAGHELKTPLTIIKAYTQMLGLMLADRGNVPEVPLIGKLEKQIGKFNGLINDLLDATKMISGHLMCVDVLFNFDSLVAEIISDLQFSKAKKILLELSAMDCNVFADKDKIEQTICNLINNADKFSPGTDSIIVRTSVKNAEVHFEVQDFGIGLKEENKEKIFDQFYQVKDNSKHNFPGLGLGLYISSEIIKREGGKIWLQSNEGEGSTFSFCLPLVA